MSSAELDNGRIDGEEWAQESASDHELRSLQAWCDRLTGLDDANLLELVKSADAVFFLIHPDRDGDTQASADFWRSVTTSEMLKFEPRPTAEATSPSYLIGFIDGAMEFWRKDK